MASQSISPQYPLSKEERSAVFVKYNKERHEAEGKRADRALGLVQRGERRPYHTTPEACSCPDFRYRLAGTGKKCKHQIHLELAQAAQETDEAQGRQESPGDAGEGEAQAGEPAGDVDIDRINDELFGGW